MKVVAILLLCILVLPIASNAEYSKYEWIAGQIWLSNEEGNCVVRTNKIIKIMIKDGLVEDRDFFVMHGYYKNNPHRWLELADGTIIDGAVSGVKEYYRERI